jgi:hypothetical protein
MNPSRFYQAQDRRKSQKRQGERNPDRKNGLDSRAVSEENRKLAKPVGVRILRTALAVGVAAFLLFAGILYLFNRPFSANPEPLSASRLTSGNLLFPVQVAVFPDRVARYTPRFLGHTEDSISTDLIASVKVQAGVVFSDVVLDTAGGSPPVVIHGLWKKDAERLRQLIGAAQDSRRKRAK